MIKIDTSNCWTTKSIQKVILHHKLKVQISSETHQKHLKPKFNVEDTRVALRMRQFSENKYNQFFEF